MNKKNFFKDFENFETETETHVKIVVKIFKEK